MYAIRSYYGQVYDLFEKIDNGAAVEMGKKVKDDNHKRGFEKIGTVAAYGGGIFDRIGGGLFDTEVFDKAGKIA